MHTILFFDIQNNLEAKDQTQAYKLKFKGKKS